MNVCIGIIRSDVFLRLSRRPSGSTRSSSSAASDVYKSQSATRALCCPANWTATLDSITGHHHWPSVLTPLASSTGQQHWSAPLAGIIGQDPCQYDDDDDGDDDDDDDDNDDDDYDDHDDDGDDDLTIHSIMSLH